MSKIVKVPKRSVNKWIKALRSGKFTQTKDVLNREGSYCCLGVACKVLIKKTRLQLSSNGEISGGTPLDQTNAPSWLKHIDSQFKILTGFTLTQLNDSGILYFQAAPSLLDHDSTIYFSFNEIADLIQLVFIEDALEGFDFFAFYAESQALQRVYNQAVAA